MLPPFFVYLVVDPAVVGVSVGVSLEMPNKWVEFLLDAHDQSVCRAAFAAIDAIVANGA